jgi:hypothetical protein
MLVLRKLALHMLAVEHSRRCLAVVLMHSHSLEVVAVLCV